MKLLQDAGHLNEFGDVTALCTRKNVVGNQVSNIGICPDQAPPNWFYSINNCTIIT